jgi:phosphoribosyl 1,2-cyclic phosphodiesterase
MDITFYGVRGSVPAPRTPAETQQQLAAALHRASQAGARFESPEAASAWLTRNLPLHERAGYGGDTTCVLVRCGDTRIIIDAGSGIRRLGQDLMAELQGADRLDLYVLFTHMHLDHIMGFPFFAPLFVPKERCAVSLKMYGGAAFTHGLQSVLSATVGAPLFPVELDQIRCEAAAMEFQPIHDRFALTLGPEGDEVRARCRRMHHPNETYGWRIEYRGMVFVMATDTEPFAAPDPRLSDLAAGADVLYVDTQYDRLQYSGGYDGISRVGWGHGYAEWCGRYAAEAGARVAIAGHHDPASGDDRVREIGERMREHFPNTVTGYDGLRVRITGDAVTAFDVAEDAAALTVSRRGEPGAEADGRTDGPPASIASGASAAGRATTVK